VFIISGKVVFIIGCSPTSNILDSMIIMDLTLESQSSIKISITDTQRRSQLANNAVDDGCNTMISFTWIRYGISETNVSIPDVGDRVILPFTTSAPRSRRAESVDVSKFESNM
jgi:hypothetical protein